MSTVSNVKSFVEEVIARLEGDSDKAVAARNHRKANSAVRGQVAALEAKKVDDEVALEEALEKLGDAKYPTKPITNNQTYIQGIKNAQDLVDSREEELASTNEALKYFEDLAEEFSK